MRPTKLTPKVQEIICNHLAIGGSQAAACALARVAQVTVIEWRRLGSEAREKLNNGEELTEEAQRRLDFLNAFEEAEAQAEQYFMGLIYQAAPTNPEHAWRWLERRRKDFAPKQEMELAGAKDRPIEIVIVYQNQGGSDG